MSAIPRRRQEPIDRAELARLLPAPPVEDLPGDRRSALKEQLMHQISQPAGDARELPAATSSRAPRGRLRLAALTGIPLVAAGAAAALVIGLGIGQHSSPEPSAVSGEIPAVVAVQQPSTDGAPAFLDRIAKVAATQPEPAVKANQFVYVKSVIAFTRQTSNRILGGASQLMPLHEREVWLPQDLTVQGLIRENGESMTIQNVPGDPLGVFNPTYAFLTSLPTDPAALLDQIYVQTKGHGTTPDGEAFDVIGQLLSEQIVPPAVAAALYRAAAKIPGVVLVPDATDARGRHGVAVARVENGERTEWIFDATSLTFLGQRSYLVENTLGGPAGMLTSTTAVLARGVTDRTGQQPAS